MTSPLLGQPFWLTGITSLCVLRSTRPWQGAIWFTLTSDGQIRGLRRQTGLRTVNWKQNPGEKKKKKEKEKSSTCNLTLFHFSSTECLFT